MKARESPHIVNELHPVKQTDEISKMDEAASILIQWG